MSDICKQWYKDYQKKYKDNVDLFNKEDAQDQFFVNVTGFNKQHCAWRYARIHGAVERMGGMANFSHYVNTCAEEDYKAFKNLTEQLKKANELLIRVLPSLTKGTTVHNRVIEHLTKIKPEVPMEKEDE